MDVNGHSVEPVTTTITVEAWQLELQRALAFVAPNRMTTVRADILNGIVSRVAKYDVLAVLIGTYYGSLVKMMPDDPNLVGMKQKLFEATKMLVTLGGSSGVLGDGK